MSMFFRSDITFPKFSLINDAALLPKNATKTHPLGYILKYFCNKNGNIVHGYAVGGGKRLFQQIFRKSLRVGDKTVVK